MRDANFSKRTRRPASPVPRCVTRGSWQQQLFPRLPFQQSVRPHQGLLQASEHVANQRGCRLNYDSPTCGRNELEHMRCCR